jgi:hypothetical protein
MGKYDRLQAYLQAHAAEEVTLSFRKIENIIGTTLPDGALKPRWWSNDTAIQSSDIQRRAWLGARYQATLYAGRKVKFTKVD